MAGKTSDLLLKQRDEARAEVQQLRIRNGELWQAVQNQAREIKALKQEPMAYALGYRDGVADCEKAGSDG